ncbi:hypothetical protein [Sneathiella sp.]|uniref:hypothetical protein n=1 Tax=Sneathiella sp. TaxID=1964365 RepID=UPI0026259C98|nr:hypothetical protein [Sneathiella sp.]MDF2368231.1 hypothetical protein [Sneathiella sp.]
MSPLLNILQQLLLNNLGPEKSDLMQKGAISVFVIALTTALSFMALFFLALAFYSWMILLIVPPLAALATAGVILLICLCIVTVTYVVMRMRPKKPQPAEETSEMVAALASLAGNELGKSVESNPKTTLLLAGIAGFAASKYIK